MLKKQHLQTLSVAANTQGLHFPARYIFFKSDCLCPDQGDRFLSFNIVNIKVPKHDYTRQSVFEEI